MREMKVGEKYHIQWIDTFDYTGWWHTEDLFDKAKKMSGYIDTIGFYIGKEKNFIMIASQKTENPGFAPWAHPIWIPRGCIKSIKKI